MTLALAVGLTPSDSEAQVVDLLPDIIVRESDLYNNDISTNIIPGRTHLRLNNGTANIGAGKLMLRGVWPPTVEGITVNQRIFRSDGSYYDTLAGVFVYHPGHSHTHFEGWSAYRLRVVLPGNGVGDVLGESEKTSFCLADLSVYDNTLPNYNPAGEFFTCDNLVQGISVGWIDVYTKTLANQNIDITDIPEGVYWLESEVDPDNSVVESDETNNIARIKVVIGTNGLLPDSYEPNDNVGSLAARPPGQPNSPNLGPCDPQITVYDLSIHEPGNDDYFQFYSNHTGTGSDFVRINFQHAMGDLDMQLLNAAGQVLSQSTGVTNSETISMNGRVEGWYIIRAYGFNGATNPLYSLTVDPPSNTPPVITMIDPPTGDVERIHGFETYTAAWTVIDSEADSTWVTVYVNAAATLDGNEVMLENGIFVPGAQGFHVVNSAEFPAGTYYVYGACTDGGTTVGDWSDGTVTFTAATDSDGDGVFDFQDVCPYFYDPDQIGCVRHGDPYPNGVTDVFDVALAVDVAFRNGTTILDPECPHDPGGRADVNCDGVVTVHDVTQLVDVAFRNGTAAFCNPCDCNPYPTGCE